MAVALPTSVAATSASCLPPQLPLISLRETVAKINMPSVVQASASSSVTSVEPVYSLTISNGEIIPVTSATVPKIVPSVATLTVSQGLKHDPIVTNPKPIIVTVSGMPGMAGKQLTTVTNVLTTPLLSAPVQMVAQHFTADKIPPATNMVTLPTISRVANNANPILTSKQTRQTLAPLLPGSIIASKGQLVIASANNPLIGSSTVLTTMSGLSLSSNIVTVTPVIMTSTAPLVTLSGNSTVTLNPVTQGQVLTTAIQPGMKSNLQPGKTIVPAAFLKPMNIGPNPNAFPMTMQPATLASAAITLAAPPLPVKDMDVDPKCDPKNPDFDPIQALEWKDGIATLPGSNIKFKLNEFGTLEMISDNIQPASFPVDVPNLVPEMTMFATKMIKDEFAITSTDDNATEGRQKPIRNKEMYQDAKSSEKSSQNGSRESGMSEELCRCENCDCFGLKIEFCKSGRFCSQSCVSSFATKNAWLKRGATREKVKRKKLKSEVLEENGDEEIKSEPSSDSFDMKKEFEPRKREFSWDEYLKKEIAPAAPARLFKEFQTYPLNGNGFQPGMRLEGIDQKHPSLFCVLTVSETRGYRVRLHFDGYSECYDFWVNADSPDIFPMGFCDKYGHQLQPPKGFTPQEFNWSSYLKASKAEAAPKALFNLKRELPNPNFRRGMKLEAVDKKNSSLVCVATVADVLDNRFLIHFDGWEDVYDYWADASSPHLHPINWCEENNKELTPPKDLKEKATFIWSKYLADTKSTAVASRHFKPCSPNEFRIGMKLEAVDRRNSMLVRVATIADRTEHCLLIHFDGWSSVYDYWVDDCSPDIHPVNWCAKTGHPLEPPMVSTGQNGPCPTPGCLGQGHIKGPKYTTHHSAFGCPYSQLNLNKVDTVGQDRVILSKESMNEIIKKAPDQGGAIDGLRRCPTPGCNGVGHVKGKYSVHHRVSGCPLAEKNALRGQQSSSTASSPPANSPSSVASSESQSDSKPPDAIKTRNGVGRGKKFKPGTGLRGRPPKHLTMMRLEAIKKAKEEEQTRKATVEEKVHNSIFHPPSLQVAKEPPLSWEHNTQLIPGLGSIKGSAVRQWSVNQVAKFVSSLKGCLDQGRLFREQLIDGEALLELKQSDLIDILHLRLGPALKVYSSIIAFRESEKFEDV